MDTLKTYREAVKRVILKYAQLRPSHGEIRLDPVFDETHDRYALMQVGWNRGQRVRGNLIYITMQDGKVCIEYDGIEQGILEDLLNQGIPEKNILLTFLPETQTAIPV